MSEKHNKTHLPLNLATIQNLEENKTPALTQILNLYYKAKDIGKSLIEHNQITCMGALALQRPEIMLDVGIPGKLSPNYSSSNRATAFASIANLAEHSSDDRGSLKGAIRHIFWQSDISDKFSQHLAQKIGNCHERNYPLNLARKSYTTLDEADMVTDQSNNIIGRELTKMYPNMTSRERMQKILDIARNDGLYRNIKNPSGEYEVIRAKINFDAYKKMKEELDSLDDNGLK